MLLMRTTVSNKQRDTVTPLGRVSANRTPCALHVINGRFFGGGHRLTLQLMDALEDMEGATTELCVLGEGGDLPLRGRSPIALSFDGRYDNPRVLWSTARQLRQVVQKRNPDILHTHGMDADLIGALALRRCRARHVSHLHVTPPLGRQESWKAGVRKRLFRYLTRREHTWFIAVSEAVRRQMAEYYGLPLERIVTVRNGVNPDEFAGEKPSSVTRSGGSLVIGAAGRLEQLKGFQHLIEAAAQLREQSIECEVRIAGSGRTQIDLERQATSLGMSERVRFVGQLRDMPSFYRNVDVFVLPSLSEGSPLTVLEAMAMGVPVIATRLAGAPEVIDDGVNGLLVPPGDAGALARALLWLAKDGELCQRIARAGRTLVRRRFTVDRLAAEVSRVYERVLAQP